MLTRLTRRRGVVDGQWQSCGWPNRDQCKDDKRVKHRFGRHRNVSYLLYAAALLQSRSHATLAQTRHTHSIDNEVRIIFVDLLRVRELLLARIARGSPFEHTLHSDGHGRVPDRLYRYYTSYPHLSRRRFRHGYRRWLHHHLNIFCKHHHSRRRLFLIIIIIFIIVVVFDGL